MRAHLRARLKTVALFLITFSGIYSISSRPEVSTRPTLSKYLIEDASAEVMNAISDRFEVLRKTDGGYEVIVPANQSYQLFNITTDYKLLEADINQTVPFDLFDKGQGQNYQSLPEIQTYLQSLQQQYPDNAQYFEYGVSSEGRPLVGLKISDFVQQDEINEKQIMLTAATHGDELITTEVLLDLADELLSLAQTDARFNTILANAEIYILPVVNPDGFAHQYRYEEGRDPNRSYPFPGKEAVESTTSIRQLRDFFHLKNITHSIDYHAYGEMIMYPWAYTYESPDAKDNASMDKVTTDMAMTNNYAHGQISKVIYVAKGSSADYYYWKNGTQALAIEIGQNKIPPVSAIDAAVDSQRQALWIFLEQAAK